VHLAREFSLVVMTFADSDHLRIEEIAPANATRRLSRVRAGAEVVSMPLVATEGITPQLLKVQFSYFSGRIAWRPILVSLVLLMPGARPCSPPLPRAPPPAAAPPPPRRRGGPVLGESPGAGPPEGGDRRDRPGPHAPRRRAGAVRPTGRGSRARGSARLEP